MKTIMPLPVRPQTPADLDVTAIAHVIDNTTDPDLFAPELTGETDIERLAREIAAADILDDLLNEGAGWDW
ncbi:MAG TPA: hypothetical protein H9836_17830 [Candidatus Nocardiopsis merdipullorum]|nr:hypothetical protein [Candidatus Nocardiopsis merdipullorum]